MYNKKYMKLSKTVSRTNPNEKNGEGRWFLTHNVTRHANKLQQSAVMGTNYLKSSLTVNTLSITMQLLK